MERKIYVEHGSGLNSLHNFPFFFFDCLDFDPFVSVAFFHMALNAVSYFFVCFVLRAS